MAQIKIEITYDPSAETLEQANGWRQCMAYPPT